MDAASLCMSFLSVSTQLHCSRDACPRYWLCLCLRLRLHLRLRLRLCLRLRLSLRRRVRLCLRLRLTGWDAILRHGELTSGWAGSRTTRRRRQLCVVQASWRKWNMNRTRKSAVAVQCNSHPFSHSLLTPLRFPFPLVCLCPALRRILCSPVFPSVLTKLQLASPQFFAHGVDFIFCELQSKLSAALSTDEIPVFHVDRSIFTCNSSWEDFVACAAVSCSPSSVLSSMHVWGHPCTRKSARESRHSLFVFETDQWHASDPRPRLSRGPNYTWRYHDAHPP